MQFPEENLTKVKNSNGEKNIQQDENGIFEENLFEQEFDKENKTTNSNYQENDSFDKDFEFDGGIENNFDEFEDEETQKDLQEHKEFFREKQRFKNLKYGIIILFLFLLAFLGIKKISNLNTKENTEIIQNTGKSQNISSEKSKETKNQAVQGYIIKNGKVYYGTKEIYSADATSFKVLDKNYAKDKRSVYYKGEILKYVNPDEFKVFPDGNYKVEGIFISADNLLKIFENKENREFLMTKIETVLKNKNPKNELENSSFRAISKFKNQYFKLKNYQRGENIPEVDRAKFAVLFLYIKITENLPNSEIRMSYTKQKLQEIIQEYEEISKNYKPEKKKNLQISGDLALDNYCIYKNGELYGCFLDKIFPVVK